MLVLDLDAPGAKDRALVKFFARAHSVDAALEGWRLALWCPHRPAALGRVTRGHDRGDAPEGVVAFGWPGQAAKKAKKGKRAPGKGKDENLALVPVAAVIERPALLEAGQRVVLARRELPAEMFHLLRARLRYEPDLAEQILGWWYGRDDELPTREPPWRPTGSLLVEGGGDLREGARCLVLVEVDDCWFVLSERALLTYAFGIRLDNREPLRFVDQRLETWRVEQAGAIDIEQVRARFGAGAAERAREDAASVEVVVTREQVV
jgi:hypothetical protein